ncbi:MAG: ABC transporter [Cyanobacteria bacterium QS_7_48_42]|nr:MAG: ABC transporter [Cyanobacteria bacterium QH_1_48_107]PSO58491.1 MAG: ABC transporter [Cyanobacteria bacterium QH_7_48_89]PSO60634.1 MAG: ABC transporter [Cyanobacteria bacterium QH_2_48_84]PSO70410.1 MAG: ABC transporter [Cyanobacteria bacterium QH_3_48_40]PSO72654.1 MAG: ABC transporter [Cyanobacteria bacterium QS_1_48_34]PSO79313.1 MAG: ABC transporter [Cyanobacteria bacterium QH_9_48_43]PSO81223.1 MAG: ABC transporter [Cyanobacteria bacterium QS_4_48_99]PSO83902.1 MAG: ABC transpo
MSFIPNPNLKISNRPRWRLPYLYDLLRELVSREMKLLYKRSVLGVAWTLINPLLQLAVFSFVFRLVLSVDVPHYASFAFCGLLVWSWFQTSLFQATGVIIANRPLIRQPGFPTAILPVVIVMTGLIHFLLALPVLIMFLLMDGIELELVVLFLPILQVLQFAFTVGVAYLLAAINVTLRDTQHTLGVLLQLLFYLTPIFYDITNVPTGYQSLYYLNPMVHIVTAYRAVLIQGTPPNGLPLLVIGFVTAGLIWFGYRVFASASDRFVEEL